VYTEATTFYAWKGSFTATQIRDDLNTWEGNTKHVDPWQVGCCVYLLGSNAQWFGWEIATEPTIYNGCGDYNYNHPADAWDGIYSQQFGQTGTGGYTGGIVQALSVTAGKTYRLESTMKYETYGLNTDVAYYMGLDPTGQTNDPNASSIEWSTDLIDLDSRETDWWYTSSIDRLATGSQMSAWFKASQASGRPAFRISLDDVKLHELDLPPQTTTVWADFDGDEDVDVADFAHFQVCFSGATQASPAGCDDADADGDTDVDVSDFAQFSLCFSGASQAPACP
jgi:hypothetical protein